MLPALQQSHIAAEVIYIPINNIYLPFGFTDLVSYSTTTGLLVRQYFYFSTEYSYVHVWLHCRKEQVHFSMAIENGEHARVFSQTLAYGNSKN